MVSRVTYLDISKEPSVTVTDTYKKDGTHLSRVMTTEDGKVISSEGPTPSRNVTFLHSRSKYPWDAESEQPPQQPPAPK